MSNLKVCNIILGNSRLFDCGVLGSGYSGEVKRVEDENGGSYALKVSNDKGIHFSLTDGSGCSKNTLILPEAAEFERLRKLYRAGIPVPRPYAFQIYSNAAGIGNTVMLMDLVKGQTLRDWLSSQEGGIQDLVSGRTIHPVRTVSEAIARINVALTLLESLLKLRKIAFFADFKPRNIMIKEQHSSLDRIFSSHLVDVGGTVLYQDISTNAYFNRVESDQESQSVAYFHALKDRYLIETTCSYISPELALLISEYDFWRAKLKSHYYRTLNESRVSAEQSNAAGKVFYSANEKNEKSTRINNLDTCIFYNYLQIRRNFKMRGILKAIHSLKELNMVENESGYNNYSVQNQNLYVPPSQNDYVRISEKSNVFTMGLILTELFGGKRTGLTSLSRLRVVNNFFLNEVRNSEFRMVLEWENSNQYLIDKNVSNTSSIVRVHSVNFSKFTNTYDEQHLSSATTADSSSFSFDDSSDNMYENNSETPVASYIHANSFFNLYRTHSYPKEGILSVPENKSDLSNATSIQQFVLEILDSTLRQDASARPNLNQLYAALYDLKKLVYKSLY